MKGAENKPVLIDNGALHIMLRDALLEHGTLKEECDVRDQYMNHIDKILLVYKQRFGNY